LSLSFNGSTFLAFTTIIRFDDKRFINYDGKCFASLTLGVGAIKLVVVVINALALGIV
jgi:hypothetical protein